MKITFMNLIATLCPFDDTLQAPYGVLKAQTKMCDVSNNYLAIYAFIIIKH